METVLIAGLVAVGIIVLTPLADRVRLPQPVLLALFGLAVAALVNGQPLRIDPDVILPLVLPPLLFAATQRTTAQEYREQAGPILFLAVGLTVASCVAVAALAHAFGIGWGAAFVLGAVVAPPDPVAATAVARRLRLPPAVVTVLEGEGLFNDATALVLYGVAVTAVLSGDVTAGAVALDLVLAVVVGVGVGLIGGWLVRAALDRLHDAAAETTVTVVAPFAVYLLADEGRGSGVLAVLTLGLFLRSYGHRSITAAGWLLGRAVWRYADYLITSIVFVLIGFELTAVLAELGPTSSWVWESAAVISVLAVLRLVWMFTALPIAHSLRWLRPVDAPYSGREALVVGWAGMRGVVTIAASLAIPLAVDDGGPFPDRSQVIVIALVCVLGTLIVQGLTLAPLVQALGVAADTDPRAEAAQLRQRATRAGLDAVRDAAAAEDAPAAVTRAAVLQYEGYLAAQEAIATLGPDAGEATGGENRDDHAPPDDDRDADRDAERRAARDEALERLLAAGSEAERAVVLEARRTGAVSPVVADEVLVGVERRAMRDSPRD